MATEYTGFHCPTSLKERLKEEAEKENRSLSNYIITILRWKMQERDDQAERPANDYKE